MLNSMNETLVEKLLRELVAMRTITADTVTNAKAIDRIEAFLASRGMHMHRSTHDGYDALVATTRPTKTPTVMLVGHTDVVAASDQMFAIEERDGRLYGRGTRDMKSALAAYMTVVDELKDNLSDYDFGIMLISDEETQDLGIIRLLEDNWRPKSVVLLDGGESWGVESLAKGALYMSVKIAGKSAHGSRPWLGDSASFKLVELLAELQKDFEGHGPDTDTLNVSNLTAGSGAFNQIPEAAAAMLDVRIIDPEHVEPIKERVRELCAKYDGTMEELVFFPVLKHDMDNPFIVSFVESITQVTGKTHEHTIAYGASDACRFDELGIPCAVTYPLSGGHHGEEEWIDKQALFDLVEILRDHIQKNAFLPNTARTSELEGARL
jgi:acetylornithine deacetylase/succinyl-diaminopimelate desuccinylase-like protein